MSPNRRIFLNIVATYGRSLLALGCGLFTVRWVLMSLGQTDYGLYGLVAGLAAFVLFFNSLLSGAIARFYAVSVGRSKTDSTQGLKVCREWFSTAIVIHTIIPVILVSIGYPVGIWAIESFLTIPPDRIVSCGVVWRYTCLSCFIGMVNVPFNAMYLAKQEIAEQTMISVISTICNFVFVWYMVNHPGDWLSRYAAGVCFIGVVPQIIICCRAVYAFPECRLVKQGVFSVRRIRELVGFAIWQMIGSLGSLLKVQGESILINKYFGARVNSAQAVGLSLSSHCNTLSASVQGAFSPAIMNAYGCGDYDRAKDLAFQSCKFGTLCMLMFVLPLILEVDEVLRIWLKQPPQFAAGLAICILIDMIVDRTASGHVILVNANGNIAKYQVFAGGSILLTLPLAWLFVSLDLGVYSIGWAMIITKAMCVASRVWLAKRLVDLNISVWLSRVVMPVVLLCVVCTIIGVIPQLFMTASLLRISITTFIVLATMSIGAWLWMLDVSDRIYIASKLRSCYNFFVK